MSIKHPSRDVPPEGFYALGMEEARKVDSLPEVRRFREESSQDLCKKSKVLWVPY
jgi:hypothetical protein